LFDLLTQVKAGSGGGWFHSPGSNTEVAAMISMQRFEALRVGIIAGAAGGLAEIAWVTLYAGMTGGDPAALARGVTTAAGASALLPAASPIILGIGVHMTLAVMLGMILALAWQTLSVRRGLTNPYPFMLAALAAVWVINFFVVLPVVSPAFIYAAPLAVSLISKLLFGAAAAEVIRCHAIFGAQALEFAKSDARSRRK
jgi:hypothetical protein